MIASLDNETIFKQAFTDKIVFKSFVKDILNIDIEVDKIETEKRFDPKVGNINFAYDIFAESIDHRVIIEIQRVDYDYNFDRFLHYHMMAIAELQKRAGDYRIDQTVYTIVVLTEPYKLDPKRNIPIKDEVMISSADPRNLQDKVIPIYGHKIIYLNHHYRNSYTPDKYLDWLNLFYESIHNKDNYKVNLKNMGIKRAVELIEYDRLSPETRHEMKISEQRKVVLGLEKEQGIKEGIEKGIKKGMDQGIKKGIKEGMEKGKNERSEEIAKQMKSKGIEIDLIAKITGLSKEQIEKFL
jgi:hypothetical protein